MSTKKQEKTEHDGKIRSGGRWTNGALRMRGMYAVVLVFNCATIRQCRSRGFDPVSRS